MNDILENIETIRRNKGYSQEYIALGIGMKQSGFSLIMSGERELKYNTLLQIASVLQENVIDVITYPDKYTLIDNQEMLGDTILQLKLDQAKMKRIFRILGED